MWAQRYEKLLNSHSIVNKISLLKQKYLLQNGFSGHIRYQIFSVTGNSVNWQIAIVNKKT